MKSRLKQVHGEHDTFIDKFSKIDVLKSCGEHCVNVA